MYKRQELARGLLRMAPPEYRPAIGAFAGQAHPILLRYVRGLLVIVLFTAIVISIGLGAIFHVRHAVLLGAVAGSLELLPVLGPTTAAFLLFGSLAQMCIRDRPAAANRKAEPVERPIFSPVVSWRGRLVILFQFVHQLGGETHHLRAVSYTHLDVYKRQT